MSASLAAIWRYPVKGMSGESLDDTLLAAGEGVPHDRRFALAHAASHFDRADPHWLPKRNFLQLLNDARLALLQVQFDAETGYLTVFREGHQVARGNITEPLGCILVEQFLDAFIEPGPRGNPHIVEAPGAMLSDVETKYVSILNLASVRDIERVARAPVDPRRFRANLHVEDFPAWAELEWPGREITIGTARLEVVETIGRCAATTVNPDTSARDINMLKILQAGFGHTRCGVYAKVVEGGAIKKGDAIGAPPS